MSKVDLSKSKLFNVPSLKGAIELGRKGYENNPNNALNFQWKSFKFPIHFIILALVWFLQNGSHFESTPIVACCLPLRMNFAMRRTRREAQIVLDNPSSPRIYNLARDATRRANNAAFMIEQVTSSKFGVRMVHLYFHPWKLTFNPKNDGLVVWKITFLKG